MRKKLIFLGVIGLLAIPAAVVSADTIELTNRETPQGVQRVTIDDQTNEVVVTLDGVEVERRQGTPREAQAADVRAAQSNRDAALVSAQAILLDIQNNPSNNPEVQRLEQAIATLAQLIGVE